MKCAHEHTGSAEAIRPSPRNGVNGFLRALPGDRAFVPPSPPGSLLLKSLTPASGRKDHTPSRSASAPFVKSASASTASRPASVTIASRPSEWDETAGDIEVIWGAGEAVYFCKRDWTTQISLNLFANFLFWRRPVARMERSAIRDRPNHLRHGPGFRFAPAGLRSFTA